MVASQTNNPQTDHTLELNRRKIDSLDKKLIKILGERLESENRGCDKGKQVILKRQKPTTFNVLGDRTIRGPERSKD